MKKSRLAKSVLAFVSALTIAAVCAACGKTADKPYYTFDVASISTVMLKGKTQKLEPGVKNLGETVANPRYKTEILHGETDVTSSVYDAAQKLFTPDEVGGYRVTFTMLKEDGTDETDENGAAFAKSVNIEVSKLTFEPKNSAGEDVTVLEEGDDVKLSFGDKYATTESQVDSGQYRVKGVTFNGNFSITYAIHYKTFNEGHPDPALYFGFDRNTDNQQDDSIKISTGTGKIAAYVFNAVDGGLADLGSNEKNGWNFKTWYNTNDSVSNDASIKDSVHYFTVNRYLNAESTQAIYALSYDMKPFVYLNVHDNFTPMLAGLWVESVNTNCEISVYEFGDLPVDASAPQIKTLEPAFEAGKPANLKQLFEITDGKDDSDFSSLFVPDFKVTNSKGEDVPVNGSIVDAGENETYTVSVSVEDLSGNASSATAAFSVGEIDRNAPVVSLEETSAAAPLNVGMRIYYSVTDAKFPDLQSTATPVFKLYSDADLTKEIAGACDSYTLPGTQTTYYAVRAVSASKAYLLCEVTNPDNVAGRAVKELTVTSSPDTPVYGYKVYDSATKDGSGVILTKDSLVFRTAAAEESVKITPVSFTEKVNRNWTVEFAVTDLQFHDTDADNFGRFNLTLLTQDGQRHGEWQDLGLGGKMNDDLWGYEYGIAENTIRYQWRSTWQDKTTEFLPDPADPTKGCGRDSSAYAGYGTSKHTYKIACSMDGEGVVTYTYYIDGEREVVHRLDDKMKNHNGTDFIQFQSLRMSGVVSDFKIS